MDSRIVNRVKLREKMQDHAAKAEDLLGHALTNATALRAIAHALLAIHYQKEAK